jgi:hypothetical protein
MEKRGSAVRRQGVVCKQPLLFEFIAAKISDIALQDTSLSDTALL